MSKTPTKIYVTGRALRDVELIKKYSAELWGSAQATKYIKTLSEAIRRIQSEPKLLKNKGDFSKYFRFYKTGQHIMVFDIIKDSIFLLAILHEKMDIETYLERFEPTLINEAKIMHEAIAGKKND